MKKLRDLVAELVSEDRPISDLQKKRDYELFYKQMFGKDPEPDAPLGDEDLDEMTSSGAAGPFQTPNAFTGKTAKGEARRRDVARKSGFDIVQDDAEETSMHEAAVTKKKIATEAADPYFAYRKDDTATPRQKLGRAIMEVNKKLQEIETIVRRNNRLRKEVDMPTGEYWKRTNKALFKIEGRIHRISQTIRSLRV